mmetsp:Transcript_82969/g.165636  ORF Transcript_82969/g.165636 Transcript_82969/m.165636 type:complete len:232 (-) Transcript_82969:333-1028(-)
MAAQRTETKGAAWPAAAQHRAGPTAPEVPGRAASDGASEGSTADASCIEQPLHTPWTFWFDRRTPQLAYADSLQRLGTVHTVQGFWRYYCNLTRPGQLQPGDNYHIFRGALQPAQETLPGGGCWAYRLKRDDPAAQDINRLWEMLLLTMVGETLGEAHRVRGAVVSVREKDMVLMAWCDDGDVGPRERLREGLVKVFGGDALLKWKSTRGGDNGVSCRSSISSSTMPTLGE